MCDCEFDVDPDSDDENTPETARHYKRTCKFCGATWWGLHCPHDGIQNPCPHCRRRPETVPDDGQAVRTP